MKRVIILDKLDSSAGEQRYRYLLWATVPAARQAFYARAGAVSAWSGASSAENTAIAAGQVVEKADVLSTDATQTLAQVRALLVTAATDYQAAITAYNPWVRYGSFFDDTTSTWTPGGAA